MTMTMTMLPWGNNCNLRNRDIQIVERNAAPGSQSAVSCMPRTKVIVRFRWIQADGCDAFAVKRDFSSALQGYRLAVAVDQRSRLDFFASCSRWWTCPTPVSDACTLENLAYHLLAPLLLLVQLPQMLVVFRRRRRILLLLLLLP